MKQNIHAMATALAFLEHKAKGLRRKTNGQLKQVLQTKGSLLANSFGMTARRGRSVQIYPEKSVLQSRLQRSVGPVKRRARTGWCKKAVPLIVAEPSASGNWRKEKVRNEAPACRSGRSRKKICLSAASSFSFSVMSSFLANLTQTRVFSFVIYVFKCIQVFASLGFGYFLRKKVTSHGLAMKAGKASGKGLLEIKDKRARIKDCLKSQEVRIKKQDFGIVRYLREWWLTRGPLPAESGAKDGQAGLDSAQRDGLRDRAVHSTVVRKKAELTKRLRLSIISFLLTLVIIYSSAGKAKSQELKIGDTIPQVVWDIPLQVLNHPQGKSSITLNEYKGKLIILDFWATSCGSCIAKMPEIVNLNKVYQERAIILPLSYQPGEKVARFMEINPIMKPLQLFTAVEDSLLKKYFPHHYLPHEVWIDSRGKVMAFTESEYLDAKNIAKAIGAKQSLAGERKEDQYLDKDKPLFTGIAGYYSKAGPHIKGFRYTSGMVKDSLEGVRRYYVINAPVLQLYALALQSDGLPLNPKRRVLEVKDPAVYVYHKDWGYQQEWRRQYTWSYEALDPIAQSITERKSRMLATLNSYFNTTGAIEQREISCLVLRPLSKKRAAGPSHDSACTSIANLLHRLNQDPAWPVMLDESGRAKEEELLLPAGYPDLTTLNAALAAHALQLVKEQRKLDVFVLRENSYSSSIIR